MAKTNNIVLIIMPLLLMVMPTCTAQSLSPQVRSVDGEYLGNLNKNKYDPNSVANPYGKYGSTYSPTSVNNSYGKYGSQYGTEGAHNSYGGTNSPVVVSPDGTYLGRLNSNKYDPESVSNSNGRYGSKYSPTSINNSYGKYGSQYSQNSANNSYGASQLPAYVNKPPYTANPMPLNNQPNNVSAGYNNQHTYQSNYGSGVQSQPIIQNQYPEALDPAHNLPAWVENP